MPWRKKIDLYLALIRWDRPAGWLLLLWPTLGALWVAADGFPGWHLLAVFVLGTILMRSAGCCINDVADREFDKHVKRTAGRPVTTGAVSVKEALVVGALLALLAFALVLTTNAITIGLSGVALAITLAYPYAKRYVSMPQAVLGLAFGMGIPMAFAAVRGDLPPLAWLLTLGLSREQAQQLAVATFAGASALAKASSEPPQVLRQRVTSKGGTTFAAISSMEDNDVRALFIDAMYAARERAKELGDEYGAA